MPEVTNRCIWFSIANSGRQLSTTTSILKNLKAKLQPWERLLEKIQNGRYDDIPKKILKQPRPWPVNVPAVPRAGLWTVWTRFADGLATQSWSVRHLNRKWHIEWNKNEQIRDQQFSDSRNRHQLCLKKSYLAAILISFLKHSPPYWRSYQQI